jgi:hypothetical protein
MARSPAYEDIGLNCAANNERCNCSPPITPIKLWNFKDIAWIAAFGLGSSNSKISCPINGATFEAGIRLETTER